MRDRSTRLSALAVSLVMSACVCGSTRRVTPWLHVRRWNYLPDWGDSTRDSLPPDLVQRKDSRGWKKIAGATGGAVALDGDRHVLLTTTNGNVVLDRAGAVVALPDGCCPLVTPDRRTLVCVLGSEEHWRVQTFADDGSARPPFPLALPPPPAGLQRFLYFSPVGFFDDGGLAIVDDLTGPDALGPHVCRMFAFRDGRVTQVEEARPSPGSPWACHNLQTWPRRRIQSGPSL